MSTFSLLTTRSYLGTRPIPVPGNVSRSKGSELLVPDRGQGSSYSLSTGYGGLVHPGVNLGTSDEEGTVPLHAPSTTTKVGARCLSADGLGSSRSVTRQLLGTRLVESARPTLGPSGVGGAVPTWPQPLPRDRPSKTVVISRRHTSPRNVFVVGEDEPGPRVVTPRAGALRPGPNRRQKLRSRQMRVHRTDPSRLESRLLSRPDGKRFV